MDIWISRCNKSAECTHCHVVIEAGEPEVFGRLWLRPKQEGGEPRRWVKTFHWHAKRKSDGQCCWLVQGLEALSRRPHVETRGRKRLVMPKESRDARLKLLHKRARLVALLKIETEKSPEERSTERMIRIGEELLELKEQIIPLGGAPKSW